MCRGVCFILFEAGLYASVEEGSTGGPVGTSSNLAAPVARTELSGSTNSG